jgi:transcriptional regulator with XRE-family HTH domain
VQKSKKKIPELDQIGTNIRCLREQQKLSRAQLAFEIGTNEKQLSRIEYGEINSGIMNYIKIARALNTSLDNIFKKIKI